MTEWRLVLFTLATQFACGLTLAAMAFDAYGSADAGPMRPLAVAIFPLVAGGVLLSLGHLGRPLMAWKAVRNARRSRLSREVILTAGFALLALAYSGFWWMGITEGRLILGAATGVAGIAAVLSAAEVYTVPSQPAWNAGWIPVSFLGTAVLLGGLTPAVLIFWAENFAILRLFLAGAAVGGALLFLATCWMLANLSRRAHDAFAAARLAPILQSLTSSNSLWLGFHVALASLLPAAVAVRLWPADSVDTIPFAGLVLAAVIFGVAVGRAVMFWLGTRYKLF